MMNIYFSLIFNMAHNTHNINDQNCGFLNTALSELPV